MGETIRGKNYEGQPVTHFAVTWEDEGTPWLVAELQETVFNTDVSAYTCQTGP